jgi:D12 class N6 adenine-specific DNA methyltransferase
MKQIIQIPELTHGRGVNGVGLLPIKSPVLKSPFPYPGGKSKIADLVWERLGNVDNYCEPFAGTLAVLLRRPADHFADGYRVETVNDLNHYIVNFHRGVTRDPDNVAMWSDNPVHEADLHARHKWLVKSNEAIEFRKRLASDPDYFDAKIAGWWCWGQCCWIGGAWCAHKSEQNNMPLLNPSQKGVVGNCQEGGRPQLADTYDIGRGVNASHKVVGQAKTDHSSADEDRHPSFRNGGVNANGTLGTCDARRAWLTDWMRRLSDRLRLVRTCYGHWNRICDSDSTLTRLGTCGIFLDPPYCLDIERTHQWIEFLLGKGSKPKATVKGKKKSRDDSLYTTDKGTDIDYLVAEVHVWCLKWGGDKNIRIALCGYEGEHNGLEALGWEKHEWQASGGYANQRKKGGKNENAKRERIWFSPSCVKTAALPTLLDLLDLPDDNSEG